MKALQLVAWKHPPEMREVPDGLGLDGGLAPKMLVPSARHLVPLGDLDPVDAAPLSDAGLTPYNAIKRSLPLMLPGSVTVMIGVGGLDAGGHDRYHGRRGRPARACARHSPRE